MANWSKKRFGSDHTHWRGTEPTRLACPECYGQVSLWSTLDPITYKCQVCQQEWPEDQVKKKVPNVVTSRFNKRDSG